MRRSARSECPSDLRQTDLVTPRASSGMAPLDGVRAKIERATEHFKALEADLLPRVHDQPYTVSHYRNPDTGWNVLRPQPFADFPVASAVVLGELIHDLRSALDHLVWQLVLSNRQVPNWKNQFPIFSHGTMADWGKKQGKARQKDWRAMLRGVHPGDVALIKSLQPYKRRHRETFSALEVLADFSNVDKHRTLMPVTTIAAPWVERIYRLALPDGAEIVKVLLPDPGDVVPVDDAYLIMVQVAPPDTDIEVEMETPYGVHVGLGERGWLPIGNLADLITEVEMIIRILKPRIEP